jgi:hypothetical protein
MHIRTSLIAVSLSLVCLVSGSAFADTLTLTGVSGGSTAGVDVYPYDFTVTNAAGSDTNVFLSCLNFNREITFGETWTVDPLEMSTIDPLATYDGELGSSYLEDAWLFNQYGTTAATDSEINFAIWSIMDPGDINAANSSYTVANAFDATSQALVAGAIANVTGNNPLPSSYFADDLAYLPDPDGSSTWTDGQPQIFMEDPPAVTPEPSGLLLLGTGFGALGIGIAATSKRRGKSKEQ